MDNYKIKVTDQVSNTKIQEALFELGCEWFGSTNEVKPLANCWIDVGSNGRLTWSFHGSDEKELTLPQLRDLVVLKRNDVNDANWETEGGDQIFKDSNDYENYIANSLTPIAQPQDPTLISGAEALRALADGKSVQWISKDFPEWDDLDIWNANTRNFLNEKCINDGGFKYRLKPQTIKVELELPKPFEPKAGEWYFFVSTENECGYSTDKFEGLERDVLQTQFGAYRTANEIEQVVEQLRKIRGAS